MNKAIAGVVVVALVGGGIAYAMTRTPERTICVRMGALCGADAGFRDYDACVQSIDDLERVVGEEPIENAAACVEEADTCLEGTGCLAGAGYKALPGLMKEFLEGFERAQ